MRKVEKKESTNKIETLPNMATQCRHKYDLSNIFDFTYEILGTLLGLRFFPLVQKSILNTKIYILRCNIFLKKSNSYFRWYKGLLKYPD